ncbi:MAG: M20 family metallopeptidase [Lawsonibacter sp.]
MNRYYQLAEEFLKELVSYPTVNGQEESLAEYIANTLKPYGFAVQIQPIAPGRSNVVAEYGQSENKVVFTGHLDVVPPGDGWKIQDPFALTEENGRLYGRGACDMKGGIASMMASAIQMVEQGEIQSCQLRLVFVVDEEVDGLGTQYYVAHEAPTDKTIVVIGEPTMLEACIAHRGVTRFKVVIHGRQCHSGLPHEGINAITQMAKFLLEVDRFDRERQSMDCGILPPPNMTATLLHSGVKENAVPGVSEVVLDCRTVPGETVESLRESILNILHNLFDGTPVTYEVTDFINVTPSSTEEDGRVCTIMKDAFQAAFGQDMVVTYFKGCCDMSYFYKAGYTQTLLCGPGSMDQAHIVDEYIEIDQLHKAVDLYTEVIRTVQKG